MPRLHSPLIVLFSPMFSSDAELDVALRDLTLHQASTLRGSLSESKPNFLHLWGGGSRSNLSLK